MPLAKPLIFISYAHLDEPEKPRGEEVAWLTFVMKFLRPAAKSGAVTVWDDRQMSGGLKWNPEIERNLRACDIFVLLVSANSMSSNYIIDKELEIARKRQAAADGFHIYPLLIEPTPKAGLDRVRDFNLRPRDAKPLQSYSLADRNQHMSDAADEIAAVAAEIAAQRGGPAPSKSTARAPAYVHTSGLPETGYERLVGRDLEMKRLDEAWSDERVNIISLVAEGGGGKSALVNDWLTRLQADGYRGAERVLGWSFYSQGSKERATAADAFLDWALDKLGVQVETSSASAKGEAIAEALMTRRTLLVLDGVEPLQHGPGPQTGQLKDQGLRALFRRFAAAQPRTDHSLIVLTSRLAVADIQSRKSGAAPVVDVDRLSEEAGVLLLRDNDVWGIDKELKAASAEFGGHPLALTLLASLLKETQNGDVRRRDHIRGLLADADNSRHDQARRVMESYEKEWLADQPILLAILHIVGLFDRPASSDCLKALRAKPVIRGLTDGLVGLTDEQWRRAVAHLREVRLLAPVDRSDPDALDAHPLVREWFGERLKETNEAAWKEAHSRLYDHLRDTTREGEEPMLTDLAPLYHAIAHGCRAGRYQEALDELYSKRICRQQDGQNQNYAVNKLGAVDSNLAAISWFFDKLYETPVAALPTEDRFFVLSEASFALRAQKRLQEALPGMRVALSMAEAEQAWEHAANQALTLSETELLVGNVADALVTAGTSVSLAERSNQLSWMIRSRAVQGNALHAAGQLQKAAEIFADAERRQQAPKAQFQILFSIQGFWYCDLFLSQMQAAAALERASQTVQLARARFSNLTIALDTLTLGRAHLAEALQSLTNTPLAQGVYDHTRAAAAQFREAVEQLVASRHEDQIPRGFIARAALRRTVGDWEGAASDLDEAEEIAEPGQMRLYLCDTALERARRALARREGYAPLNGLVEPSPPPPFLPDRDAAAARHEEARKQVDVARKLISDCSYHRRDEELAELDAVIAGRRCFADLPPRV